MQKKKQPEKQLRQPQERELPRMLNHQVLQAITQLAHIQQIQAQLVLLYHSLLSSLLVTLMYMVEHHLQTVLTAQDS